MIEIISRLQSVSHDVGETLDERDERDRPTNDVHRELQRATRLERSGERVDVSFVITFRQVRAYSNSKSGGSGSVTLFSHGYRPDAIYERVERGESLEAVLTSIANEKPGVSEAAGIIHVEMQLFPSDPRHHR